MTIDPFESSMISNILVWAFSIPLFLWIVLSALRGLFGKIEGVSRFFTLWLLICVLLFSPIRYMVLQILIASAYPCQSFMGFLSTMFLSAYIPIVFGLLYAVGLVAPLLLICLIGVRKDRVTKMSQFFAGILAPIFFIVFHMIFLYILPYAAYSTHWLRTKEVIQATNGPAYYFYRYVVEDGTALQFSGHTRDVGLENMTTKERFRDHVASVYLGRKHYWHYIAKAYPDYFSKLMQEK